MNEALKDLFVELRTSATREDEGDGWVITEQGRRARARDKERLEILQKLADAVTLAAAQFRTYEISHRAKGTPDADAKANTNARMAAELEILVSGRFGFYRCTRCGRDEIDGRVNGCEFGPCPMEYVG